MARYYEVTFTDNKIGAHHSDPITTWADGTAQLVQRIGEHAEAYLFHVDIQYDPATGVGTFSHGQRGSFTVKEKGIV